MKAFRKTLAFVLTAFMVFTMLPQTAWAASGTITESGTYNLSAYGNDSAITINGGLTVTLTGEAARTYTNLRINCGAGVDLTLNNVNIDNSATEYSCALSFTGTGNTLTLAGTNTLKSGYRETGLKVEGATRLTIRGSGSLTSTGGEFSAGIGGAINCVGGILTIDGGTVTAVGGRSASGIGGGHNCSGGTVTINGGTVTATGGDYGAGIGGGNTGINGGTVIINGGTVTANGGDYSAGIGGGRGSGGGTVGSNGNGATVTINGGTVTATGGDEFGGSAGIGGGDNGNGGTVTISGGRVTATGSPFGAGIGGGDNGSGGNVTISDGTVTAIGGRWGAGIGGGNKGNGSNVTISGGTVKASYFMDGVNIGSYQADDQGTLKNAGGADVYLTAIQLLGSVTVNVAVSSLTTDLTYTYGAKDVFSDSGGKLYLYLPLGTETTAVGTSAKTFTGRAVTENSSTVFDFAVSASLSPASRTFTAATAGYGEQTAQQFTITNADAETITGLTAAMGGEDFEISTELSDNTLNSGETATVSVRPKTGLSAGTCTDTLTVTGSGGISLTASLSFTVDPAAPAYDGPLYFKVGAGENRFYYGDPGSGGTPATDLTGWSFSGEVLTLDGFEWMTTAKTALTIVGGDLTIRPADGSENSFVSNFDGSGDDNTSGIYMASGNLTIEGDTGSLTARGGGTKKGDSAGVRVESGTLEINGGHVTAESGDWSGGESETCYGIYAQTVIIDGGTVDAETASAKTSCFGIFGIDVTVGGGIVNATTGRANGGGMLVKGKGISAGIGTLLGNVSIGGGTVTAVSGQATNLSTGIGSYGGSVSVSGGTVVAAAGLAANPAGASNPDGISAGIIAGDVTISGGTVTATAGSAPDESGVSGGIMAVDPAGSGDIGGVTISGGTVTATAGEAPLCVSGGIVADDEIVISGGIMTATGNREALFSYIDEVWATAAAYQYWTNAATSETGAEGPVDGSVTPFDNTAEGYRYKYVKIAPAPASVAPSITTDSLPGGTVGTAYSQTLAATGSTPITWSMADGSDPLPGGLTLSSNGVISGTPTAAGTFSFTVAATNAAGGEPRALSIVISPAPTYSLTIKAGAGGSITTGTGGSYAQGAVITIAASASANYSFNKWTSAGGGSFANANSASTTFTMPAGATTITAEFSYNGGVGGGPSPAYYATVEGGGKVPVSDKVPVNVDTGAGSAAVNLGGATAESLSGGGSPTVTLPSIPGVNAYTADIAAYALTSSTGALTLNAAAGSLVIPGNMLAGTNFTGEAGLTIKKSDASGLPDDVKAAIGNRPVVQLTLSIDGVPTDWNNPNAPVTVSIPYTPTAAELNNPGGIVVWYIDGSGKAVSVPNGRYDPQTGTVTFSTTHFSDYAVAYNQVSFGDVAADAWYYEAVSFIAARGITSGTGGGNFSPDAKLTRGQFLVLLMRAYEIAPDANPSDNFADAGSTYYTGYLAAAKRLGVSAGVGNNLFAPEKEITRQEMFTLLYNALKVIKQLPQGNSGKTLDNFSDAGQIASWAQEALTYLVGSGIISGNARKLTPLSTTTRAEMAQVLYNLLGK